MNGGSSESENGEGEGFDDRQWECGESDRRQIERIHERGTAGTMRKIWYDTSDESESQTIK